MKVYIVFLFNRTNHPSTTEYITVFGTKEKAEKYIENNKKNYSNLEELYFEEKTVK